MDKKLITLEEFIVKWYGKTVDTDGIWPNQCMDAMHQFCIDCLGLTDPKILSALQAKLVYENFNTIGGSELFEKIDNTPTFIPQKGDILFFGKDVGIDGHVCVFIEGDINSFRSYDANWDIKSPHIQEHNYRGALGVLRFKDRTLPVFDTTDWKAKYEEKCALETELRKVIEKKDAEIEGLMKELEEKPQPNDPQPQETPTAPVPVEVKPDPQVTDINKKLNLILSFIEALKRFIHIKW